MGHYNDGHEDCSMHNTFVSPKTNKLTVKSMISRESQAGSYMPTAGS